MSKKVTTRLQAHTAWNKFLSSIPNTDLDLLISASEKMKRGEAVLNAHELEACIRWYPQLDLFPIHQRQGRYDD